MSTTTTPTPRALPRAATLTVAARVTDGARLAFQVGRAELDSGSQPYDVTFAYDVRTGAPLVQVRRAGTDDPGLTYQLDVNALLREVLSDHVEHEAR